jgi:hypothetical protein
MSVRALCRCLILLLGVVWLGGFSDAGPTTFDWAEAQNRQKIYPLAQVYRSKLQQQIEEPTQLMVPLSSPCRPASSPQEGKEAYLQPGPRVPWTTTLCYRLMTLRR